MILKKFIGLITIVLLSIPVKAQTKEPILYVFPDSVEVKLFKHINENIHYYPEDTRVSLYLDKFNGKWSISVSFYFLNTLSESNSYWRKRTNRFAVIGDEHHPLELDYDYKFSTKEPEEIGTFGNRDEQILRSHLISDGYSITWEMIDGKIHVEENHGILIRQDDTD